VLIHSQTWCAGPRDVTRHEVQQHDLAMQSPIDFTFRRQLEIEEEGPGEGL